MFRELLLQTLFICTLMLSCAIWGESSLPLTTLKLPPGFEIHLYAKIPGARSLALGKDGTVFVGTRQEGKVYAIMKDPANATQKQIIQIADNLNTPNGIAYDQGNLYVAEMDKLWEYKSIEEQLQRKIFTPIQIPISLPNNPYHGWRYMKFGPDHELYIAIGAPCNNCISKDPIFATIARLKLGENKLSIYAKGVRNSLGLAWNPHNNNLWFTDNARDWLGDDLPPDEINIADHANMDFGFPYFFGNNQPDPIYGHLRSVKGMTPAAFNLPAHSAPLGISFYTGSLFPKKYQGQVFICEHGSWNRTHKIGYQVIMVTVVNNKPVSTTPFIMGWLKNEKDWGRPVDNLVMPDGTLLISDDKAGVVYQVTYSSRLR